MKIVEKKVQKILEGVKCYGDKTLFAYTKKFDRWNVNRRNVKITKKEISAAWRDADPKIVGSLKKAAVRITAFHRHQVTKSWRFKNGGLTLGDKVLPLESVGIYVPGGRAAYPSTVLMNAIPAKIAGVKKIVMVTPARGGKINPYTLVAADMVGIKEIYKVGGAQAVAALAYGTKTIPRVGKIVGPGNIYVATAKRAVFGVVDIDSIAGPTEVVIIADNSASPKFIAADMISQMEHDPDAKAILVSTSALLIKKVKTYFESPSPLWGEGGGEGGASCGAFIKVKSLNEAVEISNRIAPEHLEIMTRNPRKITNKIKNAGTIFLGSYAPTALGDYIAGPNHVLPTDGTARFSSPLGVLDFVKRMQVVEGSRRGLQRLGKDAINLATAEGLLAHRNSIAIRLSS